MEDNNNLFPTRKSKKRKLSKMSNKSDDLNESSIIIENHNNCNDSVCIINDDEYTNMEMKRKNTKQLIPVTNKISVIPIEKLRGSTKQRENVHTSEIIETKNFNFIIEKIEGLEKKMIDIMSLEILKIQKSLEENVCKCRQEQENKIIELTVNIQQLEQVIAQNEEEKQILIKERDELEKKLEQKLEFGSNLLKMIFVNNQKAKEESTENPDKNSDTDNFKSESDENNLKPKEESTENSDKNSGTNNFKSESDKNNLKATNENTENLDKNSGTDNLKSKSDQNNLKATNENTENLDKNSGTDNLKSKGDQNNQKANDENPKNSDKNSGTDNLKSKSDQNNQKANDENSKNSDKNSDTDNLKSKSDQNNQKANNKNPKNSDKNSDSDNWKSKSDKKNPKANYESKKNSDKNSGSGNWKSKSDQNNQKANYESRKNLDKNSGPDNWKSKSDKDNVLSLISQSLMDKIPAILSDRDLRSELLLRQSRKQNIIMKGLPRVIDSSYLYDEVRNLFFRTLGGMPEIHNIISMTNYIVIEMKFMADKIRIMKSKYLFKKEHITFEDDLTDRERQVMSWLTRVTQEIRNLGKKVEHSFFRIRLDGVLWYTWDERRANLISCSGSSGLN